jgi:predicted TIM-barrel fold metal-dependent hydrolase
MRNGHLVIDTDAHYLEPVDRLVEYMKEPERTFYRRSHPRNHLPTGLGDRTVGDRIRREGLNYYNSEGRGMTSQTDPKVVAEMHSQLGVDVSVLVSNYVLQLAYSTQIEVVRAFNDAYIDYMLAEIADPDKGIYTMPLAAWQDPSGAAAMLERVAAHPAVAGVCVSAVNWTIADERFYPLFEIAEHHALPIVFHSSGAPLFVAGADPIGGSQRLIEGHMLSFLLANMLQLTTMIARGIPERFPRLKMVFQESGLFYVPMVMYRLDDYFLKRRSEAPWLKDLPSEYIKRFCYFGTQPLEAPRNNRHLQSVMEMIGIDRLVFASDYPHWDYDDPIAVLKLGFLSDEERTAIFSGNAMTVFNFTKGGVPAWQVTGPASTPHLRA